MVSHWQITTAAITQKLINKELNKNKYLFRGKKEDIMLTWSRCANSTWTASEPTFLTMPFVLVLLKKHFKNPVIAASSGESINFLLRVDGCKSYHKSTCVNIPKRNQVTFVSTPDFFTLHKMPTSHAIWN